ncbi:hypothetical protein P4C99_00090 [Pontiellaceae bacterium B1224]|nr:hypothetical protein [Pontiellaceae bacterium B1224]
MQPPEWNKEDRAGSLNQWIEMLNEESRRQFLEAGTHVEIFFIFNDDGLMEVIPIAGMDKDEMVRELKLMLTERNGYAFIHIAEATARNIDSDAVADSLVLIAESREGMSAAWLSTVALRGDEKLLLDAVKVDGSELTGRMTGIFQGLEN